MSRRTRQRPAVGEPGAVNDRPSRTINPNRTPHVQHAEFVDDDQAAGHAVTAADWWILEHRFGTAVADEVAAGHLECRRDPITCSWYFRTPEMRSVRVEDVTEAMRRRFAELLAGHVLVDVASPCPSPEAT